MVALVGESELNEIILQQSNKKTAIKTDTHFFLSLFIKYNIFTHKNNAIKANNLDKLNLATENFEIWPRSLNGGSVK